MDGHSWGGCQDQSQARGSRSSAVPMAAGPLHGPMTECFCALWWPQHGTWPGGSDVFVSVGPGDAML